MTKQTKCCYLECDEEAEWIIYDEDISVDNDTYSCSEHVIDLLTDGGNYVTQLSKSDPSALNEGL